MFHVDMSGQQLGNYTLGRLIGVGGMGAVYESYQATVKRAVAIKILPSAMAQTPGYLERFAREVELMAHLAHPHILPVIEHGVDKGVSFLVMRIVTGGSLEQRLHAFQRPSLYETLRVMQQVSSALDYAHKNKVVHRDLKASNVLFDSEGNAYLTDFGIAKLLVDTASLTSTGQVMGTPAYMAPEQWQGEMVDARTDLYALGIMLYHMLTGQLPFVAPTPLAVMNKHFNEKPAPPTTFDETLPAELNVIVETALAKRREERYTSAGALYEALESACAALMSGAPRKLDFLTRPLPQFTEIVTRPPTPAPLEYATVEDRQTPSAPSAPLPVSAQPMPTPASSGTPPWGASQSPSIPTPSPTPPWGSVQSAAPSPSIPAPWGNQAAATPSPWGNVQPQQPTYYPQPTPTAYNPYVEMGQRYSPPQALSFPRQWWFRLIVMFGIWGIAAGIGYTFMAVPWIDGSQLTNNEEEDLFRSVFVDQNAEFTPYEILVGASDDEGLTLNMWVFTDLPSDATVQDAGGMDNTRLLDWTLLVMPTGAALLALTALWYGLSSRGTLMQLSIMIFLSAILLSYPFVWEELSTRDFSDAIEHLLEDYFADEGLSMSDLEDDERRELTTVTATFTDAMANTYTTTTAKAFGGAALGVGVLAFVLTLVIPTPSQPR